MLTAKEGAGVLVVGRAHKVKQKHSITVIVKINVTIFILCYYTSEEFFLYKITVDKRTIHHFPGKMNY